MKKASLITSSSNKVIKEIKLLHKRKERWNNKKFFIEGIRSVEQCIKSGAQIKYMVYSSELLGDDKDHALSFVKQENYEVYEISGKLFKEISDTNNPQGILVVVAFTEYKLCDILKDNNFIIVLDKVQDPGNLGTIIRTADAFGSNGVIITNGCVDVYNPKAIRSTMGSIFQIPIVHMGETTEVLKSLKEQNINIISSSLNTDKYSYDIDFKSDCAVVIGNEAKGVSSEVLNLSNQLVKIPMVGDAESLNAAIASGVLMYEVLRQRSATCNLKTSML